MLLAQQDSRLLIEFTLSPLLEDHGIPLALMGVLVVFIALSLIVLFITLLPRMLGEASAKAADFPRHWRDDRLFDNALQSKVGVVGGVRASWRLSDVSRSADADLYCNLLKECTVTDRLALTARSAMIDSVTILLGFCVGASTDAQHFLQAKSILIFGLGAASFAVATACGVLFAKLMNVFLTEKINPLIGAAGVSAVPDSARVAHIIGQEEDPNNFLLMHAMAPNVAGVIGSAIAAGVLWSQLAK